MEKTWINNGDRNKKQPGKKTTTGKTLLKMGDCVVRDKGPTEFGAQCRKVVEDRI